MVNNAGGIGLAERSLETAAPQGSLYAPVLVGLLSLNFGILFFDRNALSFLMPFVQPDLGLSNTEVGMLPPRPCR